METVNNNTRSVGIDVGKLWLDAAVAEHREVARFANTPQGHHDVLAWLRHHGVTQVGLEASGGYERALTSFLRKAGITVCVFQPAQVRGYAKFLNCKAKTDTIDAQLIARCTAASGNHRDPPDPRLQALSELMTFLEQTEEDAVRYKTRLEGFTNPAVRKQIEKHIKALKAKREALLKTLHKAVARHADLQARLGLIVSVQGIGPRTALALLIRMPELGTLSREEAASLVGVAPFDRQSGNHDGLRHIAGGRARLRRCLYAAALSAAFHHNPALINLYQRLTKAGKSHKSALIACVRKLVIYANTVVARGTPWVKAQTNF